MALPCHPAKACCGRSHGLVFRPERRRPAGSGDGGEDRGKMHLAMIGWPPVGHAGELDMADDRHEVAETGDDVAFGPANVLAVEHQFQFRRTHR